MSLTALSFGTCKGATACLIGLDFSLLLALHSPNEQLVHVVAENCRRMQLKSPSAASVLNPKKTDTEAAAPWERQSYEADYVTFGSFDKNPIKILETCIKTTQRKTTLR